MSLERLQIKALNFFSQLVENQRTYLAVLLVFSLIIKSYLIYHAQIINPDGIRYINSANELFQGNIASAFSHEKMLGYTFLLGLTHLVFPEWFLAGKVLSCATLVLTTIPLYLIARELFGGRAAFFASLIFTVVPTVNGRALSVIKDPSFLFLILLALWFVIYALKKSSWRLSLVAGFLSCLSVLIRPEGVVFFAAVALFLLASIVFLPKSRIMSLQHLASFCFIPFGTLLLAMLSFATGVISPEVLPGIYKRFAYYFRTDLTQIYMSIYQHLKSVEETFPGGDIPNDFFEFARHNMYLIYLIGLIQIFFKSMFPVFAVPFIFGLNLRKFWNRRVALFLTVMGTFLLMNYIFLMSRNFLAERYLFVPVSLGFILAGYGIDRIITRVNVSQFRLAVYFFALILCVVLPLGRSFVSVSNEKVEIKNAGSWLLDHGKAASDGLMVNDERIAFYAGLMRGDYDTFRYEEINRLEKKAQRLNTEIIAVYLRKKDAAKMTNFIGFDLVRSFEGDKHVAMIYERKNHG